MRIEKWREAKMAEVAAVAAVRRAAVRGAAGVISERERRMEAMETNWMTYEHLSSQRERERTKRRKAAEEEAARLGYERPRMTAEDHREAALRLELEKRLRWLAAVQEGFNREKERLELEKEELRRQKKALYDQKMAEHQRGRKKKGHR